MSPFLWPSARPSPPSTPASTRSTRSSAHLAGASVGPLVAAGFRVQFERLRDADRFWYERDPDFTPAEIDLLRTTRLSDVIMRNTDLTNLQRNVFFVPEPSTSVILFGLLATLACARERSRQKETMRLRPAPSAL